MTREAELSWHLHRAAVPYVLNNWAEAERIIRANLGFLKNRPRAQLAQEWVREWEAAADRGPEAVAEVAMMDGERGDDLRQVSPLAGVLPQDIRMQVLRHVREHATH